MRILIYGINFWPELTGVGKYTGEMAEWLALRGHEVRVVTAPPYYPEWRVGHGYCSWHYAGEKLIASSAAGRLHSLVRGQGAALDEEVVTGEAEISVYRCPLWVPRVQSGAKRILHLMSFVAGSLPVLTRQLFWKPDVVIGIAPPFFGAPVALLAARCCGARAWLHIQDFELDAALQLNFLPKWVRGPLEQVERFVLRRFDRVSTISPKMQEKLVMKGVA